MIRHDRFLKKASIYIGLAAAACVIGYSVIGRAYPVLVIGILLIAMSVVQLICVSHKNQSPVCKMWSSLTMQTEGCIMLLAALVGVLPPINAAFLGILGGCYLLLGKLLTRTHREVVCGAGTMD